VLVALLSVAVLLLVAGVFLQAGLSKFRSPEVYREITEGYLGRALSRNLVRAAGIAECGIAVALLLPWTRSVAALCAAAALVLYAGMIARAIASGRRTLRCGCGGVDSDTRVAPELVVRNLVLAAALLGVAILSLPQDVGVSAWPGAALGFLLFVCYQAIDELIANHQKLGGLR